MTVNEQDLDYLKRRVEQLEKALTESGHYLCPLCGGNMSVSTKYNNYYCLQTFGFCGEWLLNKPAAHRQKQPFTTYSRTTVMNGVVTPMKRGGDDYHYFFIADEMVSREEYFKQAGLQP